MDTLDPAEFAVYDAQEGDKFDFTEFDRVIKDAEPIQNIVSMLRKDLETTAKVTILTARLIAYPVRRYLKTLDLDFKQILWVFKFFWYAIIEDLNIGNARTLLEFVAFSIGFVLGWKVGIASIIIVLSIGRVLQVFMPYFDLRK